MAGLSSAFERTATPRLVPVVGNSMAPTLRDGDVAMAVPADGFAYDGLYVLELLPGTLEVARCQHIGQRRIAIRRDNAGHSGDTVLPVEDFNPLVVGQVAAVGRVLDGPLLGQMPGRRL